MHGFWAHQNILFFVGRRRYNNQLLLCVDLDLSRAEEIFQTVNDLGGSDDGTEVYHNLLGFCCVLFFFKKKKHVTSRCERGKYTLKSVHWSEDIPISSPDAVAVAKYPFWFYKQKCIFFSRINTRLDMTRELERPKWSIPLWKHRLFFFSLCGIFCL